jgi:capsular exopolysaccharide synthesis family protein
VVEELAPTARDGLVDPASPSSEAFRTLRLALQLRSQWEETTGILITSAEPRAGKSTTAANYASLSAFGGARVLLVDADVRSPAIHEIFGLARSPGLVEYVASHSPLERLVQTASPQLDVLTAGQPVARASDVSHSSRIADLLREASTAYDVVVFDAPPVLAAADAEALAAHAGMQVVFIVDGTSRRRNVTKALRRLELIRARVAGLVVNRSGEPVVYYGS